MILCHAGSMRKWGLLLNGYRVSALQDDKTLKMDGAGSCMKQCACNLIQLDLIFLMGG